MIPDPAQLVGRTIASRYVLERVLAADDRSGLFSAATEDGRRVVVKLVAGDASGWTPEAELSTDAVRSVVGDAPHCIEAGSHAGMNYWILQPASPGGLEPTTGSGTRPQATPSSGSITISVWAVGVMIGLLLLGLAGLTWLLFFRGDTPPPALPTDSPPAGLAEREQVAAPAPEEPTVVVVESPHVGVVAAPDAAAVEDTSPPDPGSSGCGKKVDPDDVGTFRKAGKGWVRLPTGYDPNEPAPLVYFFGRQRVEPDYLEEKMFVDRWADKHGFVLVTYRTWGHEVAIANVLEDNLGEWAAQRYCISALRHYAVGIGFSEEIVRELPNSVPLSGAVGFGHRTGLIEDVPRPIPPIPYLHFHGKLDRVTPTGGGLKCVNSKKIHIVRSLNEEMEPFRETHGCNSSFKRTELPGGHCEEWECDVPFKVCITDGDRRLVGEDEIPGNPRCAGPEPTRMPVLDVAADFLKTRGVDLRR